MNKKLGILFTSRNNYELLDIWLSKVDTAGFKILNIDEDSTEENKEKGKNICYKYNISSNKSVDITYIDREKRGMQWNIVSAYNYFKKRNIDWVIWFQHDCFPLTENFFNKFNDLICTGKFDEFGAVGFNVHHSGLSKHKYAQGIRELSDTARAPLEIGDCWYRAKDRYPTTRVDYSKFDKTQPFAVESVAWYAAAVNLDMYMKYIIPTNDYHFFHAWDDIAFQFLAQNIYNVCIPIFDLLHDQPGKLKLGLPENSPKACEKRDFYYGKWGHLEVWKNRWGFEYGNRATFEKIKENYKDTLLYKFYNHDPANGPLKTFHI